MNYSNQRGVSLVGVAIFSMLVASLGMLFLYYMRNGHLPMQDMWARLGKSAAVVGNEVKNATGLPTGSSEGPGMREAATTREGVRRCSIDGKTVYSDTLCLDSNPSTKKVKLSDSAGMEPPRAAVANDNGGNGATTGAAGISGTASNEELKKKIMEQAMGKPVSASSAADEELRLKSMNRAIDKATR
ncbi:hypothetical protein [Undibacterium sp. TS12]|uniref:hypothetical protein n=1 Tax=Undibacterium sp. TS12 TaxID=2908202 RepID=UPI001F4CAC4B|nr:hypothetical protein [Undibacterium sp. TS12]MCH8620327.1 hypothetical protein [Undibacterium sp. TS12]